MRIKRQPRSAVVSAIAAAVATGLLLSAIPSAGAGTTAGVVTAVGATGSGPGAGTAAVGPADAPVKRKPVKPRRKPVRPGADAGACELPGTSVWRADITNLPVHPRSDAYVTSVGPSRRLHPDFGSDGDELYGIPITDVKPGTPKVKGHFRYDDESDAGPYPIGPDARIEGGPDSDGDRHIIALDAAECRVYELFNAWPRADGGWDADSGAIFDLRSPQTRPLGWTSADAAGLSIYAGLVRYDEVAAGRIDHALRVTVSRSQRAYVWPATHYASSSTDQNLPPMGLRFRLKASVDISGLPPQARVIAQALKTYGAIVADNGSDWFFTGAADPRWDNDQLQALKKAIRGSNFEAVDASGLMVSPDSYEVRTG